MSMNVRAGNVSPSGEFRNGMPFVGGHDWLDLLNTTPFDGAMLQDLIATPTGLQAWIAVAGLNDQAAPQEHPEAVQALRETLRRAFETLRLGHPVPADVIDTVNDRLANVRRRYRLRIERGKPVLSQTVETGASGLSGAIAMDFARFVCEHEPERLKHCSNPTCTMVFYDTGKNNIRRWCTMSICGNRDKVMRYRARKSGLNKQEGPV